MTQIIGFCGSKFSGKNAAADALPGQCFGFADELKRTARAIWGLTREQTDGREKEAPFRRPVHMDAALSEMRSWTCLPIRPHGLIAKNARQVLQFWGTDYVRAEDDTYWIDFLLQLTIPFAEPDFAKIADVRFPNEAEAISAAGGTLVRVTRPGLATNEFSAHQSEIHIANLKVDYDICNDGTIGELHAKVRTLFGG